MSEHRISLEVNGAIRQDGDLSQLIWNVRAEGRAKSP